MANYLIVLSAPSGGGKTTLCQRTLKDFPELTLSISTTTRAPRGSEQNGKEYFFVSHEEFKKQIDAGRFAEWALVHGNYYGTSKDVIEKAFASGKSVLLDIDVQGAASLGKSFPESCVTIFITPPDMEVLESRLRSRGTENEATIQKRLQNARDEMTHQKHFHHIVLNDELDRAYTELKSLVESYIREGRGPLGKA